VSEIPASWKLVKLGKFLEVQGGSQPPKSTFVYSEKSGYVQLLQIRDFGEKPVPTFVPLKKVSKFCKREDVLIARYGASLGRIVTGLEGAYNVALAKVIDSYNIFSNRYLFYLLKTSIFQTPLSLLSRSAQNGFAKHEIAHIELPLPPLAEQHRIVAKIEELFSELDKGVETLKSAQAQLEVYRQAVLKYAFEGKLTNPGLEDRELPEGWELKRLEDIGSVINGDRSSNYPSRAHYVDTGVPFLSAGNIENNKLLVSSLNYITRAKFKSLRSGKTEIGDILYCLRGSLGKSAIVEIPEAAIASSLCILRPLPGISSIYVHYYLSSPLAQLEILKYDNGTAQPNLSSKSFEGFTIPICAFDEQVEIVNEIESRLSVCDKIEESIEQGLQQAEALRQSILKKAFEGKLVPQDPNDEPASVLLERIKAEVRGEKSLKKISRKKK